MKILIRQCLLLIIAAQLFYSVPVLARPKPFNQSLDRVEFDLSAEQWVATNTARVTVQVNASLNDEQLASAQHDTLQTLQKLNQSAEWHITQFDRQPGKSGLEQLTVLAETRLPEVALTGLRAKAKTASQPGRAVKIVDIEFTPSDREMEQARSALREQIYQDANAELARLNKVYPGQRFRVHQIEFEGARPIVSMARNKVMLLATESSASVAPTLSVNNKLTVTARIVLAASKEKNKSKQVSKQKA